jgi:hypothetical protein
LDDYSFMRNYIKKDNSIERSDHRLMIIDLFQLNCPFVNYEIKSEIINFDRENSLGELFDFYNLKMKFLIENMNNFENFDLIFIYCF